MASEGGQREQGSDIGREETSRIVDTARYIPGLRPQHHLVPSKTRLTAADRVNSDLQTKTDRSEFIAPRHQHRQPFIGGEPRLPSPSLSGVKLVLDGGNRNAVERKHEPFRP